MDAGAESHRAFWVNYMYSFQAIEKWNRGISKGRTEFNNDAWIVSTQPPLVSVFVAKTAKILAIVSLSLHKFSRRVSYIPHTFLFFFQDAVVKITAKFHWLWNSSRLGQKGQKKAQDILGPAIPSLEAVGRSLSGMSSREMAWGVGHWSQFQAWTERYRGTFSPNCYQIQINPHSLKHTLCPIHNSALCSSGTHEIGLRNRNSNRSFQKSIPFSVYPWK